ncbi:dTDP-4-dehydrorhamnose reductase [Undibacterium sp. FT147W]|uniref:dTDP-4-dehydrorhamnose reductase n=1 Tax=Undibacterium rivi TaxID=2828729 RepID=A0ABS5GZ60_9BURK|nr:dTDP-4-dehydrorhamnose reductase [Undibacterium rivi]MBR7791725.1 dTDP-4-dehydrorhamnose reductase [Undibacterium rivi]
MKILLTGVTGQLGHTLQQQLSAQHEVIAPDRSALDLSDAAAITAYVDAIQPNLMINPAAYTAVDKAESEAGLAAAINVAAPAAFAAAAKRHNIGLIHYSTDYVFDGSLRDAQAGLKSYTETEATHPLNVYGATKLAGEQAIIASGCRHLIFRTSWVYSRFGKNFLLTMLRLANERDELRIVNDQWGAPTSAKAISDATCQILAQLLAAPDSAQWWSQYQGLYNLTTTGHTSWCGFTEEILRQAAGRGLLNKPAPVVHGIPASEYPTPATRPVNSCLNTDKISRTFGLTLPSWQTALTDSLA